MFSHHHFSDSIRKEAEKILEQHLERWNSLNGHIKCLEDSLNQQLEFYLHYQTSLTVLNIYSSEIDAAIEYLKIQIKHHQIVMSLTQEKILKESRDQYWQTVNQTIPFGLFQAEKNYQDSFENTKDRKISLENLANKL